VSLCFTFKYLISSQSLSKSTLKVPPSFIKLQRLRLFDVSFLQISMNVRRFFKSLDWGSGKNSRWSSQAAEGMVSRFSRPRQQGMTNRSSYPRVIWSPIPSQRFSFSYTSRSESKSQIKWPGLDIVSSSSIPNARSLRSIVQWTTWSNAVFTPSDIVDQGTLTNPCHSIHAIQFEITHPQNTFTSIWIKVNVQCILVFNRNVSLLDLIEGRVKIDTKGSVSNNKTASAETPKAIRSINLYQGSPFPDIFRLWKSLDQDFIY
jgi:hypothetical protein